MIAIVSSFTLAIADLLKEPLLPETAIVGGFANGWGTETQLGLGPSEYSEVVGEWLSLQDGEAGARTMVVGGCCGIFPEHIAELRKAIDEDLSEC